MNTVSIFLSPSITLLQPCVWLVSCLRSWFSAGSQAVFGLQVGICNHVGSTIVVVWHCIHVLQGDEHCQHISKSIHHSFTAMCWRVSCLRSWFFVIFCRLSGGVWPSSGGMVSCRFYKSVVWHCIHVLQGDEHCQHISKSIHHSFTAMCWRVSCLRSWLSAGSQAVFGLQVKV